MPTQSGNWSALKTSAAAVVAGLLAVCCAEGAENLFSRPLLITLPKTLDFGTVPSKGSVTNVVLIENPGSGVLAGKATVEPPFKIISGGEYALKRGSAQVVTIVYSPSDAGTDRRIVKFTGGNGGSVTLLGRLAPPQVRVR